LPIPEDVLYSPTLAGYRAWLENGHAGTIEEFIEECGRASEKDRIMEDIMDELKHLNLEDLKEILFFVKEY